MHKGRLLAFTLSVIGIGLIQLWVLMIIVNATNAKIGFTQLLGDGGLFFFATSLAVSSGISLFDTKKIKVGNIDFNTTAIVCLVLVIYTVATYSAVLTNCNFNSPNPFSKHITGQIGSCALAIAYWYFTGIRTGLFVNKDV